MNLRSSRSARLRALTAVAGLVAAVAATVAAPPAESAPPSFEPAACPAVYPIGDLTPNQPVSMLTVSRGNTPDQYPGEVLGVIDDGFTTDLDLIMVEFDLSGQPDGVTGIWGGMSGSPVYAADGRLIGAISHILSTGPSPVAGLTPAADMKALLDGGAAPATVDARHVAIPQRMQQRLVSEGAVTAAQAGAGFDRLPLLIGVSGLTNSIRLAQLQDELGLTGVQLYRAGAAPAEPAPESLIFPGSNLLVSESYGDLSLVGTGTTTMVCDGQVVGWGHRFFHTGDSSWTMHGGNAVYIQNDPISRSFKVANPTGPVGEITGDHTAGISGPLGELPQPTVVQSTVTSGSKTRTGYTYVSHVPPYTEFLLDVAQGVQANVDRVIDRRGPGSARTHFVVEGHTADGAPFTLQRTNRSVSDYDISRESIDDLFNAVSALNFNQFSDVTIDDVRAEVQVNAEQREFAVGKVERKTGTHYVTLTSRSLVKARAGSAITLRLTLNSRDDKYGTKHVIVQAKVPNAPVGASGTLAVGNLRLPSSRPDSFDDLIANLNTTPRNDQLRAAIVLATRNGSKRTSGAPTTVSDVVHGAHRFQLTVVS